MSANTSPDNIVYPVSTDQVAPLETVLATMAISMQTAITGQNKYYAGSVADVAARTALFPNPKQGDRVFRLERGFEEAFFELFNASTNPGGATPAGWYPISGARLGGRVVATPGAKTLASGQWAALSLSSWSDSADGAITPNGISSFITGSTPNAWVAPISGNYRVESSMVMGTTGNSFISVNKNTTVLTREAGSIAQNAVPSSFSYATPTLSSLVTLSAGDVVRMIYLASTAANLSGVMSNELVFGIEFVSPRK